MSDERTGTGNGTQWLAIIGAGIGLGLLWIAIAMLSTAWDPRDAIPLSAPAAVARLSLLWGLGLSGAAVGILTVAGLALWGNRR
jgi:hypothetical protein